MTNTNDIVEQIEKYLAFIPEHLQGDKANDLVSLLGRGYTALKEQADLIEQQEKKIEGLHKLRDEMNQNYLDLMEGQQQRIAELEAYIKEIEDGSNAKHWPEFGPSGG